MVGFFRSEKVIFTFFHKRSTKEDSCIVYIGRMGGESPSGKEVSSGWMVSRIRTTTGIRHWSAWWIKAYKALAAFRGECNEKTWLIQIAMNTCRDMQRSGWFRHNDRRITPEDLPLSAQVPQDENHMDMMCYIMQLPPKLKAVIMLYYWQEMTVTDIANALGITHSTVSNRLKRARDKIRIMLERREPDGR